MTCAYRSVAVLVVFFAQQVAIGALVSVQKLHAHASVELHVDELVQTPLLLVRQGRELAELEVYLFESVVADLPVELHVEAIFERLLLDEAEDQSVLRVEKLVVAFLEVLDEVSEQVLAVESVVVSLHHSPELQSEDCLFLHFRGQQVDVQVFAEDFRQLAAVSQVRAVLDEVFVHLEQDLSVVLAHAFQGHFQLLFLQDLYQRLLSCSPPSCSRLAAARRGCSRSSRPLSRSTSS